MHWYHHLVGRGEINDGKQLVSTVLDVVDVEEVSANHFIKPVTRCDLGGLGNRWALRPLADFGTPESAPL